MTMISDRVRELLNEQVGHELSAHQRYYGISLYFEGLSLKKWARLFHGHSVEEAQHASKIIAFLIDTRSRSTCRPLDRRRPSSPREGGGEAASSEVRDGPVRCAAARPRMPGSPQPPVLDWFIEEQVEEERTMRELLDLIDSGSTSLPLSSCSRGRRNRARSLTFLEIGG
jgi:ferritin